MRGWQLVVLVAAALVGLALAGRLTAPPDRPAGGLAGGRPRPLL